MLGTILSLSLGTYRALRLNITTIIHNVTSAGQQVVSGGEDVVVTRNQ